jgi:expansin (peptidoglycan-binding protein)
MDLSETAFALIGDRTCGVLRTTYRQVPCPYSDSGIIVRQKDGVNRWWFAILLLRVNGAGGIGKVEIKDSSNSALWITATSTDYNYWIVTSGSGLVVPLSIRLTDQAGQVLTMDDVITSISTSANPFDVPTTYQFGTPNNTAPAAHLSEKNSAQTFHLPFFTFLLTLMASAPS